MHINKINNNIGFNAMISKDITINQEHGIHVRPSALIAKLSQLSDKDVYIAKQGQEPVNIRHSIMQILCLELKKGETVKLMVDETYPKTLLQTLISCFTSKDITECIHVAGSFIKSF